MKTIETQIDIRSDAQTVWSVLCDLPGYATWNPLIRSAAGEIRRGGRVRLRIDPPGGRETLLRARIVACQPGRELRWIGRLLVPGVFDTVQSLRISPTGSGVRLYHCQAYSGLASPLCSQADCEALRDGFAAMNEALRKRAEELFASTRQVA